METLIRDGGGKITGAWMSKTRQRSRPIKAANRPGHNRPVSISGHFYSAPRLEGIKPKKIAIHL